MILPVDTQLVGLVGNWVRAPVGEPGVESGLSASLDEVDCAAVAGASTSEDLEASYDNELLRNQTLLLHV